MFEQRASVDQSDWSQKALQCLLHTAPLSGMKCFPAEGNRAHMLINLRDVQMSRRWIIFMFVWLWKKQTNKQNTKKPQLSLSNHIQMVNGLLQNSSLCCCEVMLLPLNSCVLIFFKGLTPPRPPPFQHLLNLEATYEPLIKGTSALHHNTACLHFPYIY